MPWVIRKRLLDLALLAFLPFGCVYSPPHKQISPDEYLKEIEIVDPMENQYLNEDKSRDPNCFYSDNCHCKTPGKTLSWKHLYCLKLYATSNSNNDDVQSCTFGRDPAPVDGLDECQKNYHWRLNRCNLITPQRADPRQKKAFKRCLNEPSAIPSKIMGGV